MKWIIGLRISLLLLSDKIKTSRTPSKYNHLWEVHYSPKDLSVILLVAQG